LAWDARRAAGTSNPSSMAYPSDSECDPARCVLLNRLADPLILSNTTLWCFGVLGRP
jgi:hypothetical protein